MMNSSYVDTLRCLTRIVCFQTKQSAQLKEIAHPPTAVPKSVFWQLRMKKLALASSVLFSVLIMQLVMTSTSVNSKKTRFAVNYATIHSVLSRVAVCAVTSCDPISERVKPLEPISNCSLQIEWISERSVIPSSMESFLIFHFPWLTKYMNGLATKYQAPIFGKGWKETSESSEKKTIVHRYTLLVKLMRARRYLDQTFWAIEKSDHDSLNFSCDWIR